MSGGDFFESEVSATMEAAGEVSVEHVAPDGTVTALKGPIPVEAGEIVDASFMSVYTRTSIEQPRSAQRPTHIALGWPLPPSE